MAAKIINGNEIAAEIKEELKKEVAHADDKPGGLVN